MSDNYDTVRVEGSVPVKMWTRGVPVEDAAKAQIANMAKMPFVGPHIAILPDCHWGLGATVGSVIPTRGAIIPAAVGVDLGCFPGETRVITANGHVPSMAALHALGGSFPVWSVNDVGRVVRSVATCVLTRKNAALMRVVVEEGEIICTPDHEFMLPDGSYCEARKLDTGTWLRAIRGYANQVIFAEPIGRRDDVYCLQVERHHNFALAVGVFVHNCGMEAVRTTLTASDLPDSLRAMRLDIESEIPVGQAQHEHVEDVTRSDTWSRLHAEYLELAERHPQIVSKGKSDPALQIGTLGGGNHFVEVCLDESQRVWLMLHSGSRGIGNRIGTHFISLAREEALRLDRTLPDRDLAWLDEGTQAFSDYVRAVDWAQRYASANRDAMMRAALRALGRGVRPFELDGPITSCHHNYLEKTTAFGEDIWLTRKGAVDASLGRLAIIPGSMGTQSFIVRGKGNPESFHSCSHGAGRAMSRGAAKKRFTVADHVKATEGVECEKGESVLDETPGAYKNLSDVMSAQSDLIEVVATLKQILCVKG